MSLSFRFEKALTRFKASSRVTFSFLGRSIFTCLLKGFIATSEPIMCERRFRRKCSCSNTLGGPGAARLLSAAPGSATGARIHIEDPSKRVGKESDRSVAPGRIHQSKALLIAAGPLRTGRMSRDCDSITSWRSLAGMRPTAEGSITVEFIADLAIAKVYRDMTRSPDVQLLAQISRRLSLQV